MIGHTQAKAPPSQPWLTRSDGREWVTILALDLLASLILFAMKASSDQFQMIRWFTLLLLAQPGLFMTWVMVQHSLTHHRGDNKIAFSKGQALTSVLRIVLAFTILVVALPVVIELWFWV